MHFLFTHLAKGEFNRRGELKLAKRQTDTRVTKSRLKKIEREEVRERESGLPIITFENG